MSARGGEHDGQLTWYHGDQDEHEHASWADLEAWRKSVEENEAADASYD